jgi:AcrR family transcriptional regulator
MRAKAHKPTRRERNEAVKQRLFEAGIKVVGTYGYAEASVARITAAAGVSQGSFYTHYANRQELLDELLPRLGQQMLEFIRDRTNKQSSEADKEIERFRAFFDFVQEVPEFQRILNEAEFLAPKGYELHLTNVADSYSRLLRRGRKSGGVGDYSDEEIGAVVHMLMGAREYLSRRYAYENGRVRSGPDFLFTAYSKLMRSGLFGVTNE